MVPVFPGERPEEGRWEPWTHSGFSSPAASHGALPVTVMRPTCKGSNLVQQRDTWGTYNQVSLHPRQGVGHPEDIRAPKINY